MHRGELPSYAANFFEAVTARQATSFCKEDIDRETESQNSNSEIEAFNNVIATSCNRS